MSATLSKSGSETTSGTGVRRARASLVSTEAESADANAILPTATISGSTYFIDPTASANGDGSIGNPFNSWAFVRIQAGNIYVQKAGTTSTGFIYVDAKGTASSPTVIGAYGSGAQPVLDGTVDFVGASYVTLAGFSIHNQSGVAVAIQDGSHNVSIIGNTLGNALMGVWIGAGAGAGNIIYNNQITANTLDGIAIDKIVSPVEAPTIISSNTVSGNGVHGIEVDGSGFIIAENVVTDNGRSVSGASGIHIFSGQGNDGFGNGNIVVNNIAADNHDATGKDGNGIELDQYTSGNFVSGNHAYHNDGAGIVVYDSSSNMISGNTVADNGQDPGMSHGVTGGIVVLSDSTIAGNNAIVGNTGTGNASAPAVFLDPISAKNGNYFSANVWQNSSGGPVTQLGIDTSWAAWQTIDASAYSDGDGDDIGSAVPPDSNDVAPAMIQSISPGAAQSTPELYSSPPLS